MLLRQLKFELYHDSSNSKQENLSLFSASEGEGLSSHNKLLGVRFWSVAKQR